MAKKLVIVGNPNAGKSSVFNSLTGLSQKTGNFPGVTVDIKMGGTMLPDGESLKVIDLPGTYSLHPNSLDERIVLQTLLDKESAFHPDIILYVADINNLERQSLLLTQVIDLGFPIVLALTMRDVAHQHHIETNLDVLRKTLGIPVFWVNGRTGEGLDDIKGAIVQGLPVPKGFLDMRMIEHEAVKQIRKQLPTLGLYETWLTLHHHQWLTHIDQYRLFIKATAGKEEFKGLSYQVEETLSRFDKIVPMIKEAVSTPEDREPKQRLSSKLDRILTHKVWGSFIFFFILLLVFQATFDWATYPMDWIDKGVNSLSAYLSETLPQGFLNDLFCKGILSGLGGVVVFVPLIAILFLLIALLEEIGYMSRAVYLSDSLMRRFGLNGRSVVSLFSGVACAVPAIMATRSISNAKERLITIMVTPLISCSARIPVYTMLIAFVIPQNDRLGIFNMQGLAMMSLYMLGIVAALFSAWVLKKILKAREYSYLAMELPDYKIPYWKSVLINVTNKVGDFVFQAGKIILMISIVLWLLGSYGPPEEMKQARISAETELAQGLIKEDELEDKIASYQIEVSYMGKLGHVIEPVIRPLGFDWKIGIALISSFAAREVFVGTMATIYSAGSDPNQNTLRERLAKEINPRTGKPTFSFATSLSLLLFYVFAMQCISTIAIVKRETKGWYWPLVQLFYMSGLAYVVSLLTYQLLG